MTALASKIKARTGSPRTGLAGGSRLAARLETLRQRRELAMIAYLTAGDPTLEFTEKLILRLAEAGADVFELGVPFSDPIADGPVIQRESDRALRSGTTLAAVLGLAARLRRQSDVPLLLFSYYNPVLQFGLGRFAAEAAGAGVDAVLITDLTPEEAGDYRAEIGRHGLDTVFLAAPTSSQARLRQIANVSRGFVYVVSRCGVTGPRADVPDDLPQLVARLRRYTKLPLAVGFGISQPEQVRVLAGLADGVVIGSALVECCERHQHTQKAAEAAGKLVRELKRAGQPGGGR